MVAAHRQERHTRWRPFPAMSTRAGGERANDGRAVMAFAPRRRARRLFAYWRSEQRTLRQGFFALLVSTGAALVAGITTASIVKTLALLPSLYILLPAATGMRGTIFGAI